MQTQQGEKSRNKQSSLFLVYNSFKQLTKAAIKDLSLPVRFGIRFRMKDCRKFKLLPHNLHNLLQKHLMNLASLSYTINVGRTCNLTTSRKANFITCKVSSVLPQEIKWSILEKFIDQPKLNEDHEMS